MVEETGGARGYLPSLNQRALPQTCLCILVSVLEHSVIAHDRNTSLSTIAYQRYSIAIAVRETYAVLLLLTFGITIIASFWHTVKDDRKGWWMRSRALDNTATVGCIENANMVPKCVRFVCPLTRGREVGRGGYTRPGLAGRSGATPARAARRAAATNGAARGRSAW